MDVGDEQEALAEGLEHGAQQVRVIVDGERDQQDVERIAHGLAGEDNAGQGVADEAEAGDDAEDHSLEPEGAEFDAPPRSLRDLRADGQQLRVGPIGGHV